MRKLLFLLLVIPIVSLGQDSIETKKRGILSGQWRSYYMATLNKGDLKDFNALATGGKLKYQYSIGKNFELGVALYNTTNIGIQDLKEPDATTGRISRYEEGLFNRLDLSNNAVILLGELYAKYQMAQHGFTLGRMKINTPLVNPEDGRMIPTLVQGFWYEYKTKSKNKYQIGVLNEIAPRSTGRFYNIGESIGTYPVGRNTIGQASQYTGNTTSDFIILLNTDIRVMKNFKLGIWNQYTDNISNSLYLKPIFRIGDKLVLEGEWLHQSKVGNGGNAIDTFRYFNQNASDNIGARIGYQFKASRLMLSYNRILPYGQFISPREWGREDLFSFQKRERSEGTADSHTAVITYNTIVPLIADKANIKTILSLGRHWKPSVQDPVLNKYAVPDYLQLNVDLFFNSKRWKGLKPELLLTKKWAQGHVPNNPNFFFNKVDMFHVSMIINYNF